MKNKYGDEVYIDDLVPAILTADSTDLEDILYWKGNGMHNYFHNGKCVTWHWKKGKTGQSRLTG